MGFYGGQWPSKWGGGAIDGKGMKYLVLTALM